MKAVVRRPQQPSWNSATMGATVQNQWGSATVAKPSEAAVAITNAATG
jgi:hypothetical protein